MALNEEVDGIDITEDVCAICMEDFRTPKLLPCRHTFCLPCLDDLVSSKHEANIFSCPICRRKTKLSRLGVDGLLTNYFVPSAPEVVQCNICGIESDHRLVRCDKCLRRTCPRCYVLHGEDSETCGREVEEENVLSGQLFRMIRGSSNPKTVYEGTRAKCFMYEQTAQIRKLLPINDQNVWVASRHNPSVTQFDGDGNVLKKISLNGPVFDMCFDSSGWLLLTYENSNFVAKYNNSGETVHAQMTDDSEMATFITIINDGMLVVASKYVNNLRELCHLLYYDSEGNFIHKMEKPTFKHISAMCFNAVTNKVCVSDEKIGRVVLVEHHGLHQTYNGSDRLTISRGPFSHRRGFRPKTLTCDLDGNTWAYDGSNRMIHILSRTARLVGLFDTDDQIGEPNHMTFAKNGYLWMSDMHQLTIKVYKVDRCSNYLGRGSDPFADDSDEDSGGKIKIDCSNLSPEMLERIRHDIENGIIDQNHLPLELGQRVRHEFDLGVRNTIISRRRVVTRGPGNQNLQSHFLENTQLQGLRSELGDMDQETMQAIMEALET